MHEHLMADPAASAASIDQLSFKYSINHYLGKVTPREQADVIILRGRPPMPSPDFLLCLVHSRGRDLAFKSLTVECHISRSSE